MIAFAMALAWNTSTKVTLSDTLSDTIFVGSPKLDTTIVTYSSNTDISNYNLHSGCDISSKFISREMNNYSFSLKYNDQKCGRDAVFLKDSEWEILIDSRIKLKVYSDFELYDRFTDYDSSDLRNISSSLSKKIAQYWIFAEYSKQAWETRYDFYAKKIRYYQYKYNAAIIDAILAYREHKYIVPVEWKLIAQKESKLPNALRLYRASYTDGIHHGWDVDADAWDKAIALDNGIVIRVESDFTRTDFAKIKKGNILSTDDKIKNLDVLRWNQVWLKTMKWDVVFYSHLDEVFVEQWDSVFAGDPIGTIWATGIPEVWYNDFHLHFPIHKNPHDVTLAGSYDNDDIMAWDWYFKGKWIQYIREHQSDVFK